MSKRQKIISLLEFQDNPIGQPREAVWSKKFKQLTFFDSRNTEKSVQADTVAIAKMIIRNSGVRQTLKKVT
jgi:hypothetical protein